MKITKRSSAKLKNIAKGILCILAVITVCSTKVKGQGQQHLSIGDNAPALKYSKWIQGKPINSLNDGKVYVLEFWATWCGPCIQAMPHLSELSKKYEGKIVFIGCNVLEKVGGKPYESSLPAVIRFAENQKKLKRMTYNVIADNNARDMNKGWLEAAGISGIPSSFVINKGKIAWIGHPIGLDSVLAAIDAGTYDLQAAKEKYEASQNQDDGFSKDMDAAKKLYTDFEAVKDYNKALQYTDTAMARMPAVKFVFMADKFRILLEHFGEDQAIAYGNEVLKGTVAIQSIAGMLFGMESLSQRMKAYTVDVAKHMKADNLMVLDFVAKIEAKAGFWKDAAETEKNAIEMANKMKTDPTFAGFLTEDVISGYKKSLEQYQKNIN